MSDSLGRKVGVLGGGQLGRMMGYAAGRLGIDLISLDPMGKDSPAGVVSKATISGSFQEPEKVRELSTTCDVITAEIEHVNCEVLLELEQQGKIVRPSANVILTIQDKMKQKQVLETHNVPVVEWREVDTTVESVEKAVEELGGFPAMLKSRKQAYDGRGNAVLSSKADIPPAMIKLNNPGGLYLEKWAPFKAEIAVMVARRPSGEIAAYDVVETRQADNICRVVVAPPSFDLPVGARVKAQEMAQKAVQALDGTGIFGVELFWMGGDDVVLNEMAPRPHNSGHYTMEGNVTDQFEQHLRAVLDLPLADTSMRVPACAMVNILGAETMDKTLEQVRAADGKPGCAIHWYGKKENRKGRKLGHITVTANSMSELRARLAAIGEPLYDEDKDKVPPQVGIIMGSDSDLPTMKAAADFLTKFDVPFELTVVSAHRTPDRMYEYAKSAKQRGIKAIIAGAGGAAHLPGMVAALTPLPVIGVPVKTSTLNGNDSLLSIVQMPRGVPVATVAIGNSTNAGLLAVRILAAFDPELAKKLDDFHNEQESSVLAKAERLENIGYEKYLASM